MSEQLSFPFARESAYNTPVAKSPEAFVNPEMLAWARRRSGYDENGAAKRVGVKVEKLREWESGDSRPTMNQAIHLSEVYKTPLSAFYLKQPPTDISIRPADFRRMMGAATGKWSPKLLWEWRLANMRREIVLDITDPEERVKFEWGRSATAQDDAEEIAEIWRERLGITWEKQMDWEEEDGLPQWKTAIEKIGALVFFTSGGIETEEMRGFAISETPFPAIVINNDDKPNAQMFTLLHEFGHILLGESGVSNGWAFGQDDRAKQAVEMWCNKFAASALMPARLFLDNDLVKRERNVDDWADREIEELAGEFGVSADAIVRRLLTFGKVSREFYERKHKQYLIGYTKSKAARKIDGNKMVVPRHRIAMKQNGKPFTRIVLEALHEGELGITEASSYLREKIPSILMMERELYYRRG